ncbi:MAG: MCE family protein, partial [Desulfobacula sp.]|nr:MCE family protein [Desulfobacula sp.]
MKVVYKKREKIVGTFFVLIAVLLLSTVVLIGRGKDWLRTYVTYYTIFKEGYNLQENAEVKLTKANIGRVKKISLSEDKVKVELLILQEYASRIKIDSIATVES